MGRPHLIYVGNRMLPQIKVKLALHGRTPMKWQSVMYSAAVLPYVLLLHAEGLVSKI